MSPSGRAELLDLARDWYIEGRPLEMRALAAEAGVSRATLYRWAGNRERLLGEVLASMMAGTVEWAREGAHGEGVAFILHTYERVLNAIAGSAPLHRLLMNEPELALRVLTSRHSVVQRQSVAALRAICQHEVDQGTFRPPVDLDTLSYAAVRIGESFLYSDIITGTERDVAKAVEVVALMLRDC